MFRPDRRSVLFAGASAALAAMTRSGWAQGYPAKPITIICPFPAGGIVDIVIRSFSTELAAELGKPVIVQVRPGAAGLVGSTALAGSSPDGYTLMMASISHLVAPLLTKAPFHPVDDIQGISVVARSVSLACVPASLKATTIPEFISLAKAQPGKLNYLRPGHGSFGHLTVEMLKLRTGIDVQAVDYTGLPPGILDLLTDRIQLGILPSGLALPHVRDGKLRVIGTVGSVRSSEFPDAPTLAEQGAGDANIDAWYMVVAPKRVPRSIVEQLNVALTKVMAMPTVEARLRTAGGIPVPAISASEAQALLARDYLKFQALVRDARIMPQ